MIDNKKLKEYMYDIEHFIYNTKNVHERVLKIKQLSSFFGVEIVIKWNNNIIVFELLQHNLGIIIENNINKMIIIDIDESFSCINNSESELILLTIGDLFSKASQLSIEFDKKLITYDILKDYFYNNKLILNNISYKNIFDLYENHKIVFN